MIGSEIHLWFLPFAFLGSIAAFLLGRAIFRCSSTVGLTASVLIALVPVGVVSYHPQPLVMPWGSWLYGFPLIPIGLAIGMAQQLPCRRLIGHYAVILTLAFAIAWKLDVPSYFLGVLALALSILPRSEVSRPLRWFAGLSMGIYLMHPCFFLVVHKFFFQAPWYGFAAFGLVGSVAASAIIALIPQLNSLMFGAVRRVRKPSVVPPPSPDLESPEPESELVLRQQPLDFKPGFSA